MVRMRYLAPAACALLALATPALGSGSGSSVTAEAGDWTATASMSTARASMTATRLDGRVLVVGGEYDSTRDSTAELYDPATGTWILAGTLSQWRALHVAVRLADGRVLVAGGQYSTSAELYDPATKIGRASCRERVSSVV